MLFFVQNNKKTKKTPDIEPHIKRPDCDNFAKNLADSLQGICWVDDSQIWSMKIKKQQVKDPKQVGVVLTIF
jgi:Holliday junction resolvase RusA-like endonuclease